MTKKIKASRYYGSKNLLKYDFNTEQCRKDDNLGTLFLGFNEGDVYRGKYEMAVKKVGKDEKFYAIENENGDASMNTGMVDLEAILRFYRFRTGKLPDVS